LDFALKELYKANDTAFRQDLIVLVMNLEDGKKLNNGRHMKTIIKEEKKNVRHHLIRNSGLTALAKLPCWFSNAF
jgi:hypothetical protein